MFKNILIHWSVRWIYRRKESIKYTQKGTLTTLVHKVIPKLRPIFFSISSNLFNQRCISKLQQTISYFVIVSCFKIFFWLWQFPACKWWSSCFIAYSMAIIPWYMRSDIHVVSSINVCYYGSSPYKWTARNWIHVNYSYFCSIYHQIKWVITSASFFLSKSM